jgi:hypothetical protein
MSVEYTFGVADYWLIRPITEGQAAHRFDSSGAANADVYWRVSGAEGTRTRGDANP